MFFRGLSPRACHQARWMCKRPPCRWMSSKRNIPIAQPWDCSTWGPWAHHRGPWAHHRGPWARHSGPWRDWWRFPNPSNVMAQMERDMEEVGRRFQQLGSPWFGRPSPRPTADRAATNNASDLQVTYNDKEFEIRMNVDQYSPEDLNVKVIDNNLVVSGKHHEKADEFGHVTREFTRQFAIPEDCNPDSVSCNFEEGGILSIIARVKGSESSTERIINIERKGPKEAGDSRKEGADSLKEGDGPKEGDNANEDDVHRH